MAGFGLPPCLAVSSLACVPILLRTGFFGGGMMNQELTDYTQAIYIARHAAMSRLGDEASRVSAEGVVGVTIEDNIRSHEVEINNQQRRDLLVEFTALGTAIVASGSDTLAIDYALPLVG